ncbi:MAG: hypothetical protein FD175_2055 [Beijerinckiaceae bacterium]|nr:MAG: hypothetical protein FD175_2055 [Beijerinckiaceae bacterium]
MPDTRNSDTFKLSLAAQTPETALPEARAILEKAKAQVGFIPNMYAGMVNSPALLEAYLDGYGRFRNATGFSALEQEVIFLTISCVNGCEYCVAAHSFIADKKSGVPAEVTDTIRAGDPVGDARLGALVRFTRILVESRGRPTIAEAATFLEAGYTEQNILEIILAISVKTISNYANHVLHTPLDPMFAGRVWSQAA